MYILILFIYSPTFLRLFFLTFFFFSRLWQSGADNDVHSDFYDILCSHWYTYEWYCYGYNGRIFCQVGKYNNYHFRTYYLNHWSTITHYSIPYTTRFERYTNLSSYAKSVSKHQLWFCLSFSIFIEYRGWLLHLLKFAFSTIFSTKLTIVTDVHILVHK